MERLELLSAGLLSSLGWQGAEVGCSVAGALVAIWATRRWYMSYTRTELMHSCGHNCDHGLTGHANCGNADSQGEGVTIYLAKKIITMDPTWPTATAVATCNGRIVSVGKLEDIERVWGGKNARIDRTFEDLVLTPGFVEPHIHPLVGGVALSLPCIAYHDTPNPWGEEIQGCKTKKECIERLQAEDARMSREGNTNGDMIAWGWDSVAMEGHLTKEDLDAVSTKRMVAVWDCSMHLGYCNSKTLVELGITASKCAKVTGAVVRSDGQVAGQFLGILAMEFLRPVFAKVGTVKNCMKGMTHLTEIARQGGITTFAEMMQGAFSLPLEQRLFDRFFNDPSTPIRCAVTVEARSLIKANFGSTRLAVRSLRAKQLESTEKLIYNNGVKFFTDDAFYGLTMQMQFPGYVDKRAGIWNNSPGYEYFRRVEPWWRAGCRIHVHSNGDAAQDATLEVLMALQSVHPRFDHRFCFEHFGISNQSLVTRVKALGANVSVNPFYAYNRAEINEKHMGVDRAHAASRLRLLVDAGVPTAMHTDTPVAPPRPLQEISIAVNRFSVSDRHKVLAPCERVSVMDALKMKTVHAAQVIGLDGLIGTIESGKLADFTVLYEDPFETEASKIGEIKIWGTVVGGKKIPMHSSWWADSSISNCPASFFGGLAWLFAETTSGWSRWLATFVLRRLEGEQAKISVMPESPCKAVASSSSPKSCCC